MQFLRENQALAVQTIATRLCSELTRNQRVLWLVSGGSNVQAEVAVMRLVQQQAPDRLGGLAILPMDERYGPAGHADSNSQALRSAGFDAGQAAWIDVLARNVSLDETVSFYAEVADTLLANAAVVVGQFGLGADGHTAGLLPGSPAVQANQATVVGYEWSDYSRLTLTPQAMSRITVGYVLAYGDKQAALDRLRRHAESPDSLPAELLYDIAETYVYNNHIESEGNQ